MQHIDALILRLLRQVYQTSLEAINLVLLCGTGGFDETLFEKRVMASELEWVHVLSSDRKSSSLEAGGCFYQF